jgi:hypothetical protein
MVGKLLVGCIISNRRSSVTTVHLLVFFLQPDVANSSSLGIITSKLHWGNLCLIEA